VKNVLRLARITQHQETKAVKLGYILFRSGHADFSKRERYAR
jgi:hypothetical protein